MVKNCIEHIEIKQIPDEISDLSYLGEYTDRHPGLEALQRGEAFDRGKGCQLTREYQYFVCAVTVDEHRRELQRMGYSRQVAEEMARRYCRSDFERAEAYSNGHWHMIGIVAKATVSRPIGNSARRLETLQSSGLWGIESDSDTAYLMEVAQEELHDLKSHLECFNVDLAGFDKKSRVAERECLFL